MPVWLYVLLGWVGASLPIGTVFGKMMKDPAPEEPARLPEKLFASSLD